MYAYLVMFQAPLFLRSHSKEMLRGSLHNDTLFLSRLDVMDYSLLVGVDEENRELIVGIVGMFFVVVCFVEQFFLVCTKIKIIMILCMY